MKAYQYECRRVSPLTAHNRDNSVSYKISRCQLSVYLFSYLKVGDFCAATQVAGVGELISTLGQGTAEPGACES